MHVRGWLIQRSSDWITGIAKVMSQKLVKQLADAGLSSLQAVLENLGILTFSCALGRTWDGEASRI